MKRQWSMYTKKKFPDTQLLFFFFFFFVTPPAEESISGRNLGRVIDYQELVYVRTTPHASHDPYPFARPKQGMLKPSGIQIWKQKYVFTRSYIRQEIPPRWMNSILTLRRSRSFYLFVERPGNDKHLVINHGLYQVVWASAITHKNTQTAAARACSMQSIRAPVHKETALRAVVYHHVRYQLQKI